MKKTGLMIMVLILAVALLVPTIGQAKNVSACDGGPTCFEGCTPGFWKNHLEDWVGYVPGADFDTTFGVDAFNPDITLEQALNLKGGHLKALARHAVAALLNIAHPEINYPYSAQDVIDWVQIAVAAEDYESLKDTLDTANNLGCDDL